MATKKAKKEKKEAPVATAPAPITSPVAPAPEKMPTQNGVTRPRSGTATGRVWEIADQLSADANKPAPRSEVMKAGEAEGLNTSTIATQYGRWRKFHGLGRYAADGNGAGTAAAGAAAMSADAPEVDDDDDDDGDDEDEEDEDDEDEDA